MKEDDINILKSLGIDHENASREDLQNAILRLFAENRSLRQKLPKPSALKSAEPNRAGRRTK